jgi:hypothetical protein
LLRRLFREGYILAKMALACVYLRTASTEWSLMVLLVFLLMWENFKPWRGEFVASRAALAVTFADV